MKKITNNKKIVIMGGGLAGLSAGFELVKAGKKVVVVEKDKQVGGLAKTIEVNGFRFDTGPHRFFSKSNMINKWVLKIMEDEIIRVPRITRIYFDKKFFYYPIRLVNAFIDIGLWKAFKGALDYALARIRARLFKKSLLTMEDGYINQFGRTLYEIFFKRYSEKLWGRDCTEISVDWIGQRSRGLNITTIIKETFVKSSNVVSFVDEFTYPKKGIGRFSEKMAEEIKKSGGEILTACKVIQINQEGDRIVSIVVKSKNKKRVIRGDYFISSIPISDLVLKFIPRINKGILTLASRLHYRDEVQVALFVNKTHITPDTWIYIHPKEIPFVRVMEMDSWSSELSPAGTTTLVFEIACNEKDNIWRRGDNELVDMVTGAYIKEFKWIRRENIIGGYVHRITKEYPVYHLGYKQDVDRIKEYLNRFTNLQIVGRNGTFRYNNMDHSIEMGLYAAWNIIAGREKYDIESVNIEREYLEEKKIENIEDESLEEPAG